jgi:hypothetical protein
MSLFLLFAMTVAGFEFRDISPASIELREAGQPVYVYNHGMMLAPGAPENRRRAGYLHPVYAPNGVIVTDDFPRDHWHHRGIFWAWPIVLVDGKRHDQWMAATPQTRLERWLEKKTSAAEAVLAAENGWYLGDRKIAVETVRITAHPVRGGKRVLDFELVFAASGAPLEIAGSPDNNKGYGGFSVRFAPRQNTVITTEAGREAKDTDMVPHAWAQLEADYGGRRAALRIDDDPSNPGSPNGWCLRHYGFLGVNFPGLRPFRLVPGQPLRLKYRVTLTGN